MIDTDPTTEAFYRRLLMERTPEERFLMGLRMCESARATVLASLPPELNEHQKRVAILRRYYSNDFDEETLAKIEVALK